MKPIILISSLLLVCSSYVQAQFLKKLGDKVIKTAEKAVERKLEEKTEKAVNTAADKATNPDTYKKGGTIQNGNSTSSSKKSDKKSSNLNISYEVPEATKTVSQTPQVRWLDLGWGMKFKTAEDNTIKQVIAVNPYLSPERPMFGALDGIQCAPDGSLIVAGTAGLDAGGGVKGIGWWKIAPDGAITSFISRPSDNPNSNVYPSDNFSIAADGTILTVFAEEINTNKVGTKVIRILTNGEFETVVEGLENPGAPLQDPEGNIWVTNKKGSELLRISPDGHKSTNLIGDRTWTNKALSPQEVITLQHIAWDAVHGELVTGGSFITAKPHDLHSSVWRISSDGKAKRVLYTVKAGHSPIVQHIDAIRTLTVDAKGSIVLATAIINDRARRQITRLNEKTGKLEVLTGHSFQKAGFSYYIPGHEEASYDGAVAHANFRETKSICYGQDGTLFILDSHQVRRLDTDGIVRTWAY